MTNYVNLKSRVFVGIVLKSSNK